MHQCFPRQGAGGLTHSLLFVFTNDLAASQAVDAEGGKFVKLVKSISFGAITQLRIQLIMCLFVFQKLAKGRH